MIHKIFCIHDLKTNTFEPLFEARNEQIVKDEMYKMLDKSSRKPSEYRIIEQGRVIREDLEHKTGKTVDGVEEVELEAVIRIELLAEPLVHELEVNNA